MTKPGGLETERITGRRCGEPFLDQGGIIRPWLLPEHHGDTAIIIHWLDMGALRCI